MSESSVMDYLAYGYTTGEYACGNCGEWVTHGAYHACYQPSTYVPTTFTTVDSNRLAELIESERKLKEIKRILEGK